MTRAFLVFAIVVLSMGLLAKGPPAAKAEGKANAALLGLSDVSTARLTDADIRIKGALSQETAFEFANMPLSDVVNYVSDRHKIPVQFDCNALKDAGIDPATLAITRNLHGITLRSALNQVLGEHDLTWVVSDEVLLITTQEKAESMLDTRVYDVHDLVVADNSPRANPDIEALVKTVHDLVGPANIWQGQGGQGDVRGFAHNGICALVVYQTFDAHERIEKLLDDLRGLKPDADAK